MNNMGFQLIYALVGLAAMCNCAALGSEQNLEAQAKESKDDLKPAASNAWMRRKKIQQKIQRLQAQLKNVKFRENRGKGRDRNRRNRKTVKRRRFGGARRQNNGKQTSKSTTEPPSPPTQPSPPPQPPPQLPPAQEMPPPETNLIVQLPQNDWGNNGYGYNAAPGYQDARYNGYGFDNTVSQGYNGYYNNAGYNGYNRGYSYGASPGYGGYGGNGGNGGLNSYYGYNNPYYQGINHLGYGYYSKPGYGNIYNNGITPNLVTGYRGYSK